MSLKGKQLLFSLDEFIIMLAWLISLFAILYFKAYIFIVPSIIAFIVLNLALGIWVDRFIHPIENKSYRQYLTIQTIFLMIWGPVLVMIITMDRMELISIWAAVLIMFYLSIGVVSLRKIIKKGQVEKKEKNKKKLSN